MIVNLRFIERYVESGDGFSTRTVKILQASDGHVWYDVPLYKIENGEEQ